MGLTNMSRHFRQPRMRRCRGDGHSACAAKGRDISSQADCLLGREGGRRYFRATKLMTLQHHDSNH